MKLFSAHIEDLRTLYVSNLKKALDMEQKITKALPDLIENATDPELADAGRSDPVRLEQIVGNLVSNALKFAPPDRLPEGTK